MPTQSPREASPLLRAVEAVAGPPLAAGLGALAAVRRSKAVHPHGAVFRARLTIPGDGSPLVAGTFLGEPGEYEAVARFSRSVGLPRPIPDLLGISLRLPHAHGPGHHQDFLAVTSVDLPVVNRIFVPATDVQQRPYSSSLAYETPDGRVLIGVLPDPTSPRPEGEDELDRLRRAAKTGGLGFRLAVAPPLGRFAAIGRLAIEARELPELDALRFDPWNCGGGLRPAGLLNLMRPRAYSLSERAWARTRRGGAASQRLAAEIQEAEFDPRTQRSS